MRDNIKTLGSVFIATLLFAITAESAPFREYPIGDEVEINNLIIAAVWLPPVKMEMDSVSDKSTDLLKQKKGQWIHLEADIHASVGNKNGFGAGEWIPDLKVKYRLQNVSGVIIEGALNKMVAKDGPHYGAQVFTPYGKYTLTFHIAPPDSSELGRHTDPVTGVAPWWKPFDVSWDFDFYGVKK